METSHRHICTLASQWVALFKEVLEPLGGVVSLGEVGRWRRAFEELCTALVGMI